MAILNFTMLHAGPPQHTKSVHDGVIIAENDKSSHTQSRTTASTNSLLKGSRKKTGIDSVCFVYVCIYQYDMYMCVCRMFQPWYLRHQVEGITYFQR